MTPTASANGSRGSKVEWNNVNVEQSAAASKASSLVGLRSINDQLSQIIDGAGDIWNGNARSGQRRSNIGSLSVEHSQNEHRHWHTDYIANYANEDIEVEVARGYIEGLRMSQLKGNRPLPLQLDENHDHEVGDIDQKTATLTNRNRQQVSSNDLQTRTQLMSLYSKWEEKLKIRERQIHQRTREILERERQLKYDAENLSSTSKQLETIKGNVMAERNELQILEANLARSEEILKDREDRCFNRELELKENESKFHLDSEKEKASIQRSLENIRQKEITLRDATSTLNSRELAMEKKEYEVGMREAQVKKNIDELQEKKQRWNTSTVSLNKRSEIIISLINHCWKRSNRRIPN